MASAMLCGVLEVHTIRVAPVGMGRRGCWRFVHVLGVAIATTAAILGAAMAEAVVPSAALTAKAAAEAMYIGEPGILFAVIENKSDGPLVGVSATIISHEFRAQRLPGEPAVLSVPPRASAVMGFTLESPRDRRPGKYTIVVAADYRWRLGEAVAGPVRLVTHVPIELRDESAGGVTAPAVSVSAHASGDTLREGSTLDVHLFVQNKSAIPLETVAVTALPPPAVKAAENSAPFAGLPPFSTERRSWTIALDHEATQGLKYGKHALIFEVTYQWRQAGRSFTSRAIAPLEFSASFFGAEGFSQVFGIPLHLIVFVLPGFALLFVHHALSARLLGRGEGFTPTTKDGIFYSVVWSVFLIFLYRFARDRDLYTFFTSLDLVLVSGLGVVAGAVVPAARYVARRRRKRATAAQERAMEALRFSDDDGVLQVLEKALHRRLDLDDYDEVTVRDGDATWRGILLSRTGDQPPVLGAQIGVSIAPEASATLERARPTSVDAIAAFKDELTRLEPSYAIAWPITRQDAAGSRDHPRFVKILTGGGDVEVQAKRPLWEIKYR